MFGGYGAQGGYPPPQQQGYSQPMRNGPPPAKKAKNNPIITRYAPPPGYQGPAQQQAPYQQQGWPQQPQPQSYGQQYYPGYPPQAHGQYQHYPQNQWQAYGQQQQQQHHGYSQGYYPQQQAQAQAWAGPAPAPAPTPTPTPNSQLSAGATNPANWQVPPSVAPQSAPPQSWPPGGDFLAPNKRRHQSEPFVNANIGPGGPVFDGNGDPVPPESPRCDTDGGLEDDFDGECYFLRHPQDIDPDLSIGELVWYPAQPSTLALPSTWKESQLELIAPRKDPPRGETSVSEYFFHEKREETLLSVRLTDEWWNIKDDVIFKEFSELPKSLLPMSDILAKYRDRPDPNWTQRPVSETPEPELRSDVNGGALNGDGTNDQAGPSSEDGDILGNLEHALRQNSTSRHGRHSRANSTTSITSNHSSKWRPLMPVRDRAQDDVLAALGVTGSPKMVYQTPGPAFGPPASQSREGSVSRAHSRQSSVVSDTEATRAPPPPPSGQPRYYTRPHSSHNTWQSHGPPYNHGYDGSRRGSNASYHSSRPESSGSRPGSSASRHTANGSDFGGGADQDRTPRPKYQRTDSRKRGYEDYDQAGRDDDATPKQQRYKQPRVDGAYARRW